MHCVWRLYPNAPLALHLNSQATDKHLTLCVLERCTVCGACDQNAPLAPHLNSTLNTVWLTPYASHPIKNFIIGRGKGGACGICGVLCPAGKWHATDTLNTFLWSF